MVLSKLKRAKKSELYKLAGELGIKDLSGTREVLINKIASETGLKGSDDLAGSKNTVGETKTGTTEKTNLTGKDKSHYIDLLSGDKKSKRNAKTQLKNVYEGDNHLRVSRQILSIRTTNRSLAEKIIETDKDVDSYKHARTVREAFLWMPEEKEIYYKIPLSDVKQEFLKSLVSEV